MLNRRSRRTRRQPRSPKPSLYSFISELESPDFIPPTQAQRDAATDPDVASQVAATNIITGGAL